MRHMDILDGEPNGLQLHHGAFMLYMCVCIYVQALVYACV